MNSIPTYNKKLLAQTSLFDIGEFIAIDGEGFNAGDEQIHILNPGTKDAREYVGSAHEYALLSASDGGEIYNPDGALTTKQCLDFLIETTNRHEHPILVMFGAGYDFTHMLRNISRENVRVLLKGDGTSINRKYIDVTLQDRVTRELHDYRIELRSRRQLTVRRWPNRANKYVEMSGRWILTKHDEAIVWDTWGFFQGSFREAMKTWLPNDPDALFIEHMKGERAIFQRSEIEEIRRYNQAELRCLVSMMELLRGSLRKMELPLRRWDGAGAIAATMMRKHAVRDHMQDTGALYPEVARIAAHAYSGGHIEAMKLGWEKRPVHHYDITSAYPDCFRRLPSLAGAAWKHHGCDGMGIIDADDINDFSMLRVSWRFRTAPFYPLFSRAKDGSITYPERGHGWYWKCEVDIAREFARLNDAISFDVHEIYECLPATDVKPFGWVADYFAERQAIIARARERGVPDGRQIAIRLGLNSLYGKTAQLIGGRWEDGKWKKPSYHQLEWAGYVTAGCRAAIMAAAIQAPKDVIALATDGIFSTAPLKLATPPEKILGTWEYKQHDGMVIVMPGVYWTGAEIGKDADTIKHFSRGFEKDKMKDFDFIIKAWRENKRHLAIPSRRMITLGQALTSDFFWQHRGCFMRTKRMLKINGDNVKRQPIAMTAANPARGMVPTKPRDLFEDYADGLAPLLSHPYGGYTKIRAAQLAREEEDAASERDARDA